MKKVISYLRIKEWLDSKVTFMMGIFLLCCFHMKTGFETGGAAKAAAFFMYVSMFLAISYVANDYADMEVDKIAGKEKVIAETPGWLVWVSFILMGAAGNIPVLLYSADKAACAVIIILTYIGGLAYSTLGIRFKERGVWGLVECSFAQRCMPLLMIYPLLEPDMRCSVMLAGWIVLSFIDGLRYIVIHQVNDLENDVAAGVNTFVTQTRGNYRRLMAGLLTAEVVITCVLLIPLWVEKTVLTLAFVLINAGLEYCIYVVIQKYAKKDILLTYDSVPLEAFYNTLFPVLTGLCMASLDIRWTVFLLLIIMVSFKAFMVKCRIAAVYIRSRMMSGR